MTVSSAVRRTLTGLGVIVLAAGSAAVAGGTPAQADTRYGCVYPRVCFYKTAADWNAQRPTAAYRDYGRQNLGPASINSAYAYNSRNDDGARIYSADSGGYACLKPNQVRILGYGNAIQIVDAPDCF